MNAPALNLFAAPQGAAPQGAAPQGSAAPVDSGVLGVFDALLASLTGEAPAAEGQSPNPEKAESEKTDLAAPDPAVQPQVAALFTPPAPMTQAAPAEGEAAPQTLAPAFAPEAAPLETTTPEAKAPPQPAAEIVPPEAPAAPVETAQVETPEAAPAAAKPEPEAATTAEAKPAAPQAQPQDPVRAQERTQPPLPGAPRPTLDVVLNPQLAEATSSPPAQAAAPTVVPAPATPAKAEAKLAKGEKAEEKAVTAFTPARRNAEAPAPTLGEETVELAQGDIPAQGAAPDPEAPPPAELKPSPAPAANAAPHSNAAAALAEHAPAVAVRGSPETVQHLAAQILGKLEARTTRFEIALDPLGLGHVDVSMEIGADGKLTASMAFDTPQAAAELRGRAGELRQALEQAGFELSRDSLSFDVAHQGHRERETPERNPRNARAFQATMASDEEIAALPHAFDRRTSGVDVRI